MNKRLISLLLALLFLLCACPFAALAAAKQMEDNVPVWTEETVRDYALKYARGEDLETLRGYYDLQIRRYMPMYTYEAMLTEIEWMTGKFVGLGSYHSFEEPKAKTKTHVLHLCMEKQDLDMYFTHKNKPDDWEIMAVEFVPAEKQAVAGGQGAEGGASVPTYTESEVTVGNAPYELKGVLTLPEGATAPVAACVLVHDTAATDRNETLGQTRLFADLAHAFAEKGIATLRYDKRTFLYGDQMTGDDISVEEEIIQDAIAAGKLLQANAAVDPKKIVLVGHGMGAMLSPRIAQESDGLFSALLLIAGTPKPLLDVLLDENRTQITTQQQTGEQGTPAAIQKAEQLSLMTKEAAQGITLFGRNGYYFWEMQQHDPLKIMKKLKLPTYFVQGNTDFVVSVEAGVEAYEDGLGEDVTFADFQVYRGLNHLLMKYTGDVKNKGSAQEYDTPATLDTMAARDMAGWINARWALNPEDSED